MALVFSKQILSGSSFGQPIQVDAVTSPGTTLHTVGPTATTDLDMVYLYAANMATAARTLILEVGATATGDETDISIDLIAGEGLNLVLPGWPLTATTSIVRAIATATGEIRLGGYVHRATAT